MAVLDLPDRRSNPQPFDNLTPSALMQKLFSLFKDFYYPENAGFPIGKADSPKVVILEIHYDNPENKEGTY